MAVDKEKLRRLLLEQNSYKASQVDGTIQRLLNMDPQLVIALEEWMETGTMPEEPVYYGLTPKVLKSAYPLKPPAVFLLMDWIRRDPQEAFKALQYEYGHLPEQARADNKTGNDEEK